MPESNGDIEKLPVIPLILFLYISNDLFRLKIDTSKTSAGGAFLQFHLGQWVLNGYHSKIYCGQLIIMVLQSYN